MALSDIVTVNITLQNGAVSRDGFGTPLVAGYHPTAFGLSTVLTFNTASFSADMLAAGFTASDPLYKAVAAIAAASPSTPKVKLGKLSAVATQRTKLTPTVVASTLYSFSVKSPAGAVTNISFTSSGSPTVSTIAAQLIPLLPVGLTGTDQTTFIRIVSTTPGQQWSFYNFSTNFNFLDETPIAGSIATELSAIAAADNDWYGLVLASKGLADAALASSWIESQNKIFAFATQDTDVATALTTDVGTTFKTGSRMRTVVIFANDVQEHSDAAFLGKLLPYTPGSETWKFKTLAGITVSTLTATQRTNLIAKNVNYYEAVKGRNITAEGKVSGGEWIDAIRLRDAIQSRVSEDVFGQFAAQSKIKYDDGGIASIEATVRGALQFFVEGGGLLSFTTTFPKASAVSSVDKANRSLAASFTATLAGAIHFTAITGTLSV